MDFNIMHVAVLALGVAVAVLAARIWRQQEGERKQQDLRVGGAQ